MPLWHAVCVLVSGGRAETRSPGLLVLSSLGGQRGPRAPSVNAEADGALENVWPHQKPKKTKNKNEKAEKERKATSLRPIEPETPNNRTEAERTAEKNRAQSAGEKRHPQQKEKDVPSMRAKQTNRVLCGNLT